METIVIQDTDPDILNSLTMALEMEGFKVCTAINCDEKCLEIIDRERPHVVVLDYKLDGEFCIRLCRIIKSQHPHLPVIALSCNNNIHHEYDQNGFDDYISKPFSLDVLYSILRKHIPRGNAYASDVSH